ncbi:MAG: hypothetical protein LBQ66_02215, partial [Planctomycetaceae bacterium]|nr:hypothetical protein [Planctomycetaceae bacterium]
MCGITSQDARVPVRAASRQLSATPTGEGLEYQHDSRTNFVGSKLPSLTIIFVCIRLVPQPKTSHDRLVQKLNLRRLGDLGRQKTGFFTICPL